jgi:DNA modification methylase
VATCAGFLPQPNHKLYIDNVIHCPGIEKEYGEWQQSLPVAKDLVIKLSDPRSLIVDPHLGTGTNAVATALIGEGRRFIGCDKDPEMLRIARYRVATEGISEAAEKDEMAKDEHTGPIPVDLD